MNPIPHIVTLTLNPALDKSSRVEQVSAERKLRCEAPSFYPGGGGINVARVAHELGGRAKAYWMSGGPTGDMLEELLDEQGICHQPIEAANMTRENLTVFEQSSGQQFRFLMPGPRLLPEDVDRCLDLLQSEEPVPDYLVLSGSLPAGADSDLYTQILRHLSPRYPESHRPHIIVDTSGPALRETLAFPLFLIKPNLAELAELAGKEIENDDDIRHCSQTLIQEGKVQVVATSLGSGGVTLTTGEMHENIRAPVVPIRSKVGAGDATVGGIVWGLAQGFSIRKATRLGVAAGAATVMTAGTQLCRRADALRLFEQLCDQEPN